VELYSRIVSSTDFENELAIFYLYTNGFEKKEVTGTLGSDGKFKEDE
jgi:hypothetical protein